MELSVETNYMKYPIDSAVNVSMRDLRVITNLSDGHVWTLNKQLLRPPVILGHGIQEPLKQEQEGDGPLTKEPVK